MCQNPNHNHAVIAVDEATEQELATIGQGARIYCVECNCEWDDIL